MNISCVNCSYLIGLNTHILSWYDFRLWKHSIGVYYGSKPPNSTETILIGSFTIKASLIIIIIIIVAFKFVIFGILLSLPLQPPKITNALNTTGNLVRTTTTTTNTWYNFSLFFHPIPIRLLLFKDRFYPLCYSSLQQIHHIVSLLLGLLFRMLPAGKQCAVAQALYQMDFNSKRCFAKKKWPPSSGNGFWWNTENGKSMRFARFGIRMLIFHFLLHLYLLCIRTETRTDTGTYRFAGFQIVFKNEITSSGWCVRWVAAAKREGIG